MKILALILAGGRVNELDVLTLHRPKSAVPFGGLYRIIDFALSNLMHSGINLVGVLSQYRSDSLIHHVGTGAAWDFIGRKRGVHFLPPSQGTRSSNWYRGTADAVYQNLDFIDWHAPDKVLILSGDHIYKMDYQNLIQFHNDHNSDLTISFVKRPHEEGSRFGLAHFDDEADDNGGKLIGYDEKPETPGSNWASMTVYLFNTPVLRKVLQQCEKNGTDHFGKDIIPGMIDKYNVYGYKFHDTWAYTQTLDEYWQANMELLKQHPLLDIKKWQLRTNLENENIRDRVPTQFGANAKIKNSFVYSGSKILGKVENSIIFPGVDIGQNAMVKDSVLFYDAKIQENATLDKTILDVRVNVGANTRIGFGKADTPNRRYPKLLTSGITIVGRDAKIPSDIKISKNCIIGPALSKKDFTRDFYATGEYIE